MTQGLSSFTQAFRDFREACRLFLTAEADLHSLLTAYQEGNFMLPEKTKNLYTLEGIGSGTTMGIEYTMTLPLNGGGNVAIDVYGVSEILRPMSKIDLEPALKFFKESVKNDDNINETLKDEIAKANIYRFIEGNLDMLLGIKLLGLFPKIVHSLSCGWTI